MSLKNWSEKKIETNVNTIVESNNNVMYSEPYTCISKENIPTG